MYTVPKETAPKPSPATMPHDHPMSDAATPLATWTTPAGWQAVDPSEFRLASFRVTGPDGKTADVSVIPLPGLAGGDLSNVNRWRGQVGQPPVTEAELGAIAEPLVISGQPAALYDQSSDTTRILAVIHHREGTAWFFKMTGETRLVADQKPVFREFLRSFVFAGADAPAAAGADALPRWTPPADWQAASAGQFLVAKFTVADGQAAVNISSSAGDGGGLGANVNRWRNQLGLGALSATELTQAVTTLAPGIALVEMQGEGVAVVGVIVSRPDETWFYKLTGETAAVAAQRDAFLQFVREVQY